MKFVLMLLAVSVVAFPASSHGAGFVFSQDQTASYYCTVEQQAQIVEQGNGAVDLLRFGADVAFRLSGSGGPAQDLLTQHFLDEAQHWMGGMPAGDPMHPNDQLNEWQSKLQATGNIALRAAQGLDLGEVFGICLKSDDTRCPAMDAGGAKDTIAFFVNLEIGMQSVPTIAFCPRWFAQPRRGDDETRLGIYFNQSAVLAHELGHKAVEAPVFDDFTDLDLDHAAAYAGHANAGNNSANFQFFLAGIDNRRKHEGSGGSDYLGGGPGTEAGGCTMTGRSAAADAFPLLVLVLGISRRKRGKSKGGIAGGQP